MSANPVQLVNVAAAVSEVEKIPEKERRRLINEYLRGIADPTTSGGKALLHRRALFLTELRVKKVWTG